MERHAQFIELGLLDRADRFLDADTDKIRRGYVLRTHGAGFAIDVPAVVEHRHLAVPVTKPRWPAVVSDAHWPLTAA